MASTLSNRVRELREAQGLSQIALAAAIGLTRQSVHSIESGRASPSVDVALRIARTLDCQVESLFGESTTDARLSVEPVGDKVAGRVALAHIAGRWLSYSLKREGIGRSADAIAKISKTDRLDVEVLRPAAESMENVVLMGCAPALGLLADRLNKTSGPGRFIWFGRSSTKALEGLGRQQTHVAGVHLVDLKTGEINVPDVRKYTNSRAVTLITLARWEVGIVVQSDNAQRISCVAHFAKRGVRLAAREPGSGARRLLERELKRADVPPDIVRNPAVLASGHLEVAYAVAIGAADAGIATRDAALTYGLNFVPLAEERYDLVVPQAELTDPRISRMLDVMTAAPLRRELSSLGYDVEPCGNRVAEIGES